MPAPSKKLQCIIASARRETVQNPSTLRQVEGGPPRAKMGVIVFLNLLLKTKFSHFVNVVGLWVAYRHSNAPDQRGRV